MYKILVWCPLIKEHLELLRTEGHEVKVWSPNSTSSAEIKDQIINSDALMVGLDTISAEIMRSSERLKIIARFGIGVDTIDVEEATKLGIMVTNTPGASKIGVSELTIGLMFCLARQLPQHHLQTKAGSWNRQIGFELFGKTLGVVGLGQIGKEVAQRAVCLGMQVVACDIAWDQDFADSYGIDRVDFEELLSIADFVSLHVPATPETIGLISEKQLAIMKPGAMLVNAARGTLIDENSLFLSLKSGHLSGAALDVYGQEPPNESPLLELNNVIFSPHLGGETRESQENYSRICMENVRDFFRGQEPPNVVNSEVLGYLNPR